MYDYREAMAEDIRTYIVENDIDVTTENREEVESNLQEELWVTDGVTGNASGSYTFSRRMAQEYVMDNIDILDEACSEFGTRWNTSQRSRRMMPSITGKRTARQTSSEQHSNRQQRRATASFFIALKHGLTWMLTKTREIPK